MFSRHTTGSISEEEYDDLHAEYNNTPPPIYKYIPQACKSRAMVRGALLLGHCDYILHVDDDTILPPSMIFDEELV